MLGKQKTSWEDIMQRRKFLR
ncbi:MAG: hypothetical protein QOE02_690, partial [Rhodospirillaceae bacterium]|nr:hypothetical protein [Rhodospirillaceae bacterium]